MDFARAAIGLFDDPENAKAIALRAREHVVEFRDMPAMTRKLVTNYRSAVSEKRTSSTQLSNSRS